MAYPIIPVVRPERTTSLFFRALATKGTKGGEQIADVEVIINVSVSILNALQRRACNIMDPNMATVTKSIMR